MDKTKKSTKSILIQYLLLALFIAAVFIGDKQVNIWLGTRAIENTELPAIEFSQAMVRAKQANKPVLANFAAIWCPACRNLDNKVLSEPSVRNYILANFQYVRLEYEDKANRQWFDHYEISSFPSLLIIDANNNRSMEVAHTTDIPQFLAQLQAFVPAE
jgi:thiol:disulfide interchange protein